MTLVIALNSFATDYANVITSSKVTAFTAFAVNVKCVDFGWFGSSVSGSWLDEALE